MLPDEADAKQASIDIEGGAGGTHPIADEAEGTSSPGAEGGGGGGEGR